MNQYMVSIITPCYNAGSTILQTIESVLAQTYSDWEMLIIDDCSTDNSAEIIKSFIISDNRIKYLKTSAPSGSPAIPRNVGIDASKGDYMAFLDADDIWLPSKLEEQLEFARRTGASFVYSDYEKMSYDGVRSNRLIRMRASSTYWDILESCSIPCLTAILKKDIIGSIRFKSIVKEDYAFWLEILRRGNVAYNTQNVHAVYRESNVSRSSNKFAMFKNQWFVLRQVEGVKTVVALYFMLQFGIRGLIKYFK